MIVTGYNTIPKLEGWQNYHKWRRYMELYAQSLFSEDALTGRHEPFRRTLESVGDDPELLAIVRPKGGYAGLRPPAGLAIDVATADTPPDAELTRSHWEAPAGSDPERRQLSEEEVDEWYAWARTECPLRAALRSSIPQWILLVTDFWYISEIMAEVQSRFAPDPKVERFWLEEEINNLQFDSHDSVAELEEKLYNFRSAGEELSVLTKDWNDSEICRHFWLSVDSVIKAAIKVQWEAAPLKDWNSLELVFECYYLDKRRRVAARRRRQRKRRQEYRRQEELYGIAGPPMLRV